MFQFHKTMMNVDTMNKKRQNAFFIKNKKNVDDKYIKLVKQFETNEKNSRVK